MRKVNISVMLCVRIVWEADHKFEMLTWPHTHTPIRHDQLTQRLAPVNMRAKYPFRSYSSLNFHSHVDTDAPPPYSISSTSHRVSFHASPLPTDKNHHNQSEEDDHHHNRARSPEQYINICCDRRLHC